MEHLIIEKIKVICNNISNIGDMISFVLIYFYYSTTKKKMTDLTILDVWCILNNKLELQQNLNLLMMMKMLKKMKFIKRIRAHCKIYLCKTKKKRKLNLPLMMWKKIQEKKKSYKIFQSR